MSILSEEVVGCVYVANKLKDQLKNPNSLNIISANCINDKTSMYIEMVYSASNSLGGTVENKYYCIIDIPTENNGKWSCKLDDLFASYYRLELVNGALGSKNAITSQEHAQKSYKRYSDKAIAVNANQIMDNLSLEITEIK